MSFFAAFLAAFAPFRAFAVRAACFAAFFTVFLAGCFAVFLAASLAALALETGFEAALAPFRLSVRSAGGQSLRGQ